MWWEKLNLLCIKKAMYVGPDKQPRIQDKKIMTP